MNILVPIVEGFEEIELVSIVDTLRRAEINVILTKDSNHTSEFITGAHHIKIKPECTISQINTDDIDGISLAGGYNGMLNLKNNKEIINIIQTLNKQNKLISAICASPIVLDEARVLKNKFTCYPGCQNQINSKARYTEEIICIDENIITANGPASGVLFGLEIIKKLLGETKYNEVKNEMLVI